MDRKSPQRCLGLGLLALLLAGCGMGADFDAAGWRAQQGSTAADNPRAGMLAALEREHLREGMTREAVNALLGAPERRLPRSDHYRIGAAPLGADYETYVVEYDERDRVIRFGMQRS